MQVFRGLAEELGLTESSLRKVMSEADENDDGIIEYREFIPIAVDLLMAVLAKQSTAKARARQEALKNNIEGFLLHGMPKAELEQLLSDIFRQVYSNIYSPFSHFCVLSV